MIMTELVEIDANIAFMQTAIWEVFSEQYCLSD